MTGPWKWAYFQGKQRSWPCQAATTADDIDHRCRSGLVMISEVRLAALGCGSKRRPTGSLAATGSRRREGYHRTRPRERPIRQFGQEELLPVAGDADLRLQTVGSV